MDILTLIQEARKAGLSLSPVGDRLEIRGPREARRFAEKLGAHKHAVLVALTRETTESFVWHASLLAEWDSAAGYCPGRCIIRNGIEHKREDCTGRKGWRHVWGGTFCCDCWPCTDAAAKVEEGSEP